MIHYVMRVDHNTLLIVHYFFLFGVYRPTPEFFTHMETSPFPVKGYKFRPMLGTYSH